MSLFLQQQDEISLGDKYVSFLVSFVMVGAFDLFGMDDFEDCWAGVTGGNYVEGLLP